MLLVVLLVGAIYLLFPKVVGIDDAMARFDEATWYWVVIAVGFNVLAFAAYVALFRGVLGGVDLETVRRRVDWRVSYQITMAGLAATRIFSAAGAGGIVLTYWALKKAGLPTRRAACRMVAFLALMYGVYTAALVIFGILLRTGVFPGDAPFGGTVVPAVVAAGVMAVFALMALIPRTSSGASPPSRVVTAASATSSAWPRDRPRSPRASAPRSPSSGTRAGARWR